MARTAITGYKSYNFVNDKDPVIDEMRTLLQDAGMSYSDVEEAGGPKRGTLYNWFHKNVRRPQHGSIKATVLTVPGCDYGIKYPRGGVKKRAVKKNRDKLPRARRGS